MSSIEASLKKAELNIQWNQLNLVKVEQWLKAHYDPVGPITSTTEQTTTEAKSSSCNNKPFRFFFVILIILALCFGIFEL